MSSRRVSVATTRSTRERAPSVSDNRYQRQASLSMLIEEGRPERPSALREGVVSQSFLRDYFIGRRDDEPKTLTRANTGLSPLEEYTDRHEFSVRHPGVRWGERRQTETLDTIMMPGLFQKPFDEPDDVQQAQLEKPRASTSRTATGLSDLEQARQQPRHGDRNGLRRFFRRSAIKPPLGEPQFIASLPHVPVNTILSQPRRSLDNTNPIHVLDYRHEAGILSSSPPQPFGNVTSLQQYLQVTGATVAMRVIYTRNDEESISSLSSDFGISSSTVESGERSFFDWMQEERASRRAVGKAIRWRPAYDTARNLICAAFAVDFGRPIVACGAPNVSSGSGSTFRIHLVESQQRHRLAVYIQRQSTSKIPGARTMRFTSGHKSLPSYAACPTIIISEYSSSGVGDIFSPAPLLGLDISGNDTSETVTRAIEDILSHLGDGIWRLWNSQITLLHEPHAELEDFIWSRPSDSSRAREVWSMSQKLHTMLKHINRHATLLTTVQEDFKAFAERGDEQDWLQPVLDEFRQLSETILVDYVQPLEHMIDLMYKSVTIRDSRQSLELNASLWRLSWITFVFLPLTFLSGFFGMNVDTFQSSPSIKWYFASAIPLLLLMVAFWYSVRKFVPESKKMDYSPAELDDS